MDAGDCRSRTVLVRRGARHDGKIRCSCLCLVVLQNQFLDESRARRQAALENQPGDCHEEPKRVVSEIPWVAIHPLGREHLVAPENHDDGGEDEREVDEASHDGNEAVQQPEISGCLFREPALLNGVSVI